MVNPDETQTTPIISWLNGIIYTVIMIGAMVLSFICNNGFDPIHFIAAFCCPICYIPFGIFCFMSKRRLSAF